MSQSDNMAGVRDALRMFQYGLHVLTCGRGKEAHAATVSWVTQVSFSPRRVAVAVRKDSHIYPVLKEVGTFALNVVGEGQEELAAAFFRYVAPGERELAGHPFEDGPHSGTPILIETPAWLECRVVEEANAGGDHALMVADVLAGGVRSRTPRPLALSTTKWTYGG